MLDEMSAVKSIHESQKKWRRNLQIIFIVIIVTSSVLFVIFPKFLPGMLMQIIMLFSMAAVFGLFFLDRLSYLLNKKYFKQDDIVYKYLFQHMKPDDLHKDAELIVDLVSKRRSDNKKMRSV